jgi:hypothetical protein
VEGRRLAADVLAQHIDLVRRHVQPVVSLVGDEQVVALDPADAALDHPLVAADAVLDVDHVHAGLEVLERGQPRAPRTGTAVGAAAAGDVALRDDGQPGGGKGDAVVERSDDDVPAGTGQVARAGGVDGEVEALVAKHRRQSLGRSVAVGGDDDAVATGQELA